MPTPTRRLSQLTPITPAEESLPYWSRSTNPIVRRHLGLYWRTLPPELRPVLLISLAWVGVMLLNTFFPSLANYTLVTVIVSLVIIPAAALVYGHILLTVAIQSADMMQEEKRNNTLNLLRATPMTLEQLLLGKVSAALWRRMEDWVLINYAVAFANTPLYYAFYGRVWLTEEAPFLFPVAVTGAMAVALLRLMLEPMMVGVIGVFVGALTPYRNTAISLSVALSVAYFGLLWLVGQASGAYGEVTRRGFTPPNHALIVLLDYVLPLALPIVISAGLLRLTAYLITRD